MQRCPVMLVSLLRCRNALTAAGLACQYPCVRFRRKQARRDSNLRGAATDSVSWSIEQLFGGIRSPVRTCMPASMLVLRRCKWPPAVALVCPTLPARVSRRRVMSATVERQQMGGVRNITCAFACLTGPAPVLGLRIVPLLRLTHFVPPLSYPHQSPEFAGSAHLRPWTSSLSTAPLNNL